MDASGLHHGSCLCGGVTFVAKGPLRDVWACHCGQCRRTSGHYWAATSAPLERLTITAAGTLAWYDSSPAARRGFCQRCGASLFWKPEGEARMAIAPGAFDGPTGLHLARHIYTEDAGDYYSADGPPPAPAVAAPDALDCACLCGGVAFGVSGPAGEITACHCRQCRKLSGHYSASFDVDRDRISWLRRDTERTFRTPGGATRGFCGQCGSSLWFDDADGNLSIEAGAIVGATVGQLCRHIHVGCKGDYYQIADGLPQHQQEA